MHGRDGGDQRREIQGVPASPGVGIGEVVHEAPAPPLQVVLVAAELSPADVVSLDHEP